MVTQFHPREGDSRPLEKDSNTPLTWRPGKFSVIRWLPRHGNPMCVVEWISQHSLKLIAFLPVYTAIVVTIVLVIQIFGWPLIDWGP